MVRYLIVCSLKDPAGVRIKDQLLRLNDFEPLSIDKTSNVSEAYQSDRFAMVVLQGSLLESDGIDRALNIEFDEIIFASRHASKDRRKVFCLHHSGNIGKAKYGGRDRELTTPSPQTLKHLFKALKHEARGTDYHVTLEATHHGPSNIQKPSLFIEIGSTPDEWEDMNAASLVARAILSLDSTVNGYCYPVAASFGGTHYAPRQTRLLEETDVTFGHIFPDYHLNDLAPRVVKQALRSVDFVYVDRKSTRVNIKGMVNELDCEILRESEIRDIIGIPWDIYSNIKERAKVEVPNGMPRLTRAFKASPCMCDVSVYVENDLIEEASKLNQKALIQSLEKHRVVFIEEKDGALSNCILGKTEESAKKAAEDLTLTCVKVLKSSCRIEYDPSSQELEIIKKHFSPEMALQYGIEPGPKFGVLKKGESVIIDDEVVHPEMVFIESRQYVEIKESRKVLESSFSR